MSAHDVLAGGGDASWVEALLIVVAIFTFSNTMFLLILGRQLFKLESRSDSVEESNANRT